MIDLTIDNLAADAPSDADINNRVLMMIRALYPEGAELKLMRQHLANPADTVAAAAFATYNSAVEAIRAQAVTARTAVLVLRGALAVEAAAHRLAQYPLSVGRPQQTLAVPTGRQVLDPKTNLMTAETITQTIPAIAPLPATVSYADASSAITQVPNPAIVQDDAERAAAQAIISAATPDITALVALRKTKRGY